MKYTIFLISFLLISCGESVPDLKVEYGIQCELETINSTYDVTLLPANITSKIVEYLNLEYGAPQFSESIEVEDLKLVGDYTVCQQKVRYWQYDCSEKCWATVQPYMGGYLIGMVDELPPRNHLTN